MNNSDDIVEKIISAVEDFSMLKKNDNVIVAVSGGADSMTLLHSLMFVFKSYQLNLIAAHLNHGIRGEEALKDENFVCEYCQENKIRYEVCHKNVKKTAEKMSLGTEECGRRLRYDFFNKLALKYNAKIATGHTLSDRVETTIFNITRGSGLKGIVSIAPKRDNIIRPLIYVTRKETEFYCKNNKIQYVTDSTNLSRIYNRNLIRLDIIPKLKKINPDFENAVFRLIKSADEDNKYIEKKAIEAYSKAKLNQGFDLKVLNSLNNCILVRVIRMILGEINITMQQIISVEKVIRGTINAVNVSGNRKVFIKNNILFCKQIENTTKTFSYWSYEFKTGNIITPMKRKFTVELIERKEFEKYVKVNKKLFKNSIDYDTISNTALFRNRLPGDKFQSAGNSIEKKLKKVFNEKKVPVALRKDLILLISDGKIIWAEKFGVSELSKIKNDTKKIILIHPKGK